MKVEKLTSMPSTRAYEKNDGQKKVKRDGAKTHTEDAVTMEGDRRRKDSSGEEPTPQNTASDEEALIELSDQEKPKSVGLNVVV